MATFTPLISVSGVASCVVGGIIHLIAWTKGKEASQLESLKEIDKLSDLKHKVHLVPVLVAVRGQVWTDKPLKCELTDQPAAIVEESLEQQFMRQVPSAEWVRDQLVLRATSREAPWALQDGFQARLPVVHALHGARISLELAGDRFISAEQGLTRRAMDALMGWRVLGLRHRERILPVGALVTVIGELAQSDAGGGGGPAFEGCVPSGKGRVLVLQAPAKGGAPFIVSSQRLPEMVASLNRVSKACRTVANVCIGVGAVLVAVKAVQGALLLWQRRKHRRLQEAERQRRRLAALNGQSQQAASGRAQQQRGENGGGLNRQEGDREPDLCSVCLDAECDTLFLGCKHLCVCERCAASLSRCPLCRARSRPLTVFRA